MVKRVTIIELISLLFTLAVLSAASVYIYNHRDSQAYQSEVVLALSAIKTAQSGFFSQHGHYAGDGDFFQITEEFLVQIMEDEPPELRRVDYEDFFVSLNYPQSDEMLIVWVGSGEMPSDRMARRKAMDHEGKIYINSGVQGENGLPKYPHER